jgi:hypothetical protein
MSILQNELEGWNPLSREFTFVRDTSITRLITPQNIKGIVSKCMGDVTKSVKIHNLTYSQILRMLFY